MRGKKAKYMAGGGKTKKYMAGGGKVEGYQDYVKRMFGGGMTKKKLNYKDGGTTDPTIATIKRRKSTKKLQAKLDENPKNSITVGTKRAKRPLDGKRSRGRKYDRANAGTKFSDSKDVKSVI